MVRRFCWYVFLVLLGCIVNSNHSAQGAESAGTLENPIVDSKLSLAEALDGLDPHCPAEIRERQRLVDVLHWGFDDRVHRGQIVVDRDLEADVIAVFALALKEKFKIQSVIPVADPRFRREKKWSDDLSMAANNSSGFNFRPITGGGRASNHAFGRAIDLNPLQNPYVKGTTVLPPLAKYDSAAAGTLVRSHPIVQAFLQRGWQWGGDWTSLKDYQHFEKPLPENR